ncbi:L,D-transpeptidase [Halobacillus sp. A5]|uniref:L,D-transpeptidase n=1 Tax=Halobacillus sp. A5 TaxID=2880263 RepID=UPI0020A6C305|nr:L,D-transpeptidase [Halobacillus sp. A5]MCP3025754.1 L,D-transpeptidase [Halobacillus sp. A5]
MPLLNILLIAGAIFIPPAVTDEPLVIVNKTTNELVAFQHGEPVFESKVATGKTEELTPEGEFTFKVKAIDPYYRKKDIPGGDPENPLGSRWIGFDAKGTDGRIYGVHGTNKPDSIGMAVSAGCIRMKNEQVEKLYSIVEEDSDIIIMKGQKDFEKVYESWEREQLKQYIKE